jgi:RC169 protein
LIKNIVYLANLFRENNMRNVISELLKRISDEISITVSMKEDAKRSYEAVGKYLGNNLNKDIYIFAQGSMALGTVVRPINDAEEYDIDLVCLIKDGQDMAAHDIKSSIGASLKSSIRYSDMLKAEGTRCWTLEYTKFHMDILPSVPRDKIFDKQHHSNIRLTHKISNDNYEDRYSNPLEYQRWFKKNALKGTQYSSILESRKAEIDNIPEEDSQGNLQSIIKLLKRHRDIFMEANSIKYKPTSIIITTLAAQGYKGSLLLYDELMDILCFLSQCNLMKEPYTIQNPIDPNENFADKWNEDERYKDVFNEWVNSAISDFSELEISPEGIDELSIELESILGEAPVKRALANFAENKRVLRDQGKLGVDSLSTGLSLGAVDKGIVKKHTFYGGKDE